MAFDLDDDATAREFARALAEKFGKPIVVRDALGKEVCVVGPLGHEQTTGWKN